MRGAVHEESSGGADPAAVEERVPGRQQDERSLRRGNGSVAAEHDGCAGLQRTIEERLRLHLLCLLGTIGFRRRNVVLGYSDARGDDELYLDLAPIARLVERDGAKPERGAGGRVGDEARVPARKVGAEDEAGHVALAEEELDPVDPVGVFRFDGRT